MNNIVHEEKYLDRYATPSLHDFTPLNHTDIDDIAYCPSCGKAVAKSRGSVPRQPTTGFAPTDEMSTEQYYRIIDSCRGIILMTNIIMSILEDEDEMNTELYRKAAMTKTYWIGHTRKILAAMRSSVNERG